jgi:hypothetical protein
MPQSKGYLKPSKIIFRFQNKYLKQKLQANEIYDQLSSNNNFLQK